MIEPLRYRATKWACQKLTTNRNADQHDRLKETEYDVLVVLDACRADTLQDVISWPVDTAITPETKTFYWIKAMERSGLLGKDTHIIAGNAQYSKIDFDASIDRCWETEWNTTLSTVLPEAILKKVSTHLETNDGPVIAHLQQPHWPYVAHLSNSWKHSYNDIGPWKLDDEEVNVLQVAMARGLVDSELAKQAYQASIRSVWTVLVEYLEQWIDDSLTVVVTADHGELFGRLREWFLYEHPVDCHIKPLTTVPWITFSSESEQDAPESVEETLKALGYAD